MFAFGQRIDAAPVAKQPPAQYPGGGVQIDVQNQTEDSQQLRVREPGGNWYVFNFPAHGGLNLRCSTCSEGFEAALLGDRQLSAVLTPGTEYEILYGKSPRRLELRPKGAESGKH
jgi:hypothetical protein